MEMTKKKWFTLLGFGAAVALPMSMIIHTANEGLKAAIITDEHRKAVEEDAITIDDTTGEFSYDLEVHGDAKLALNAAPTIISAGESFEAFYDATESAYTGFHFDITDVAMDDFNALHRAIDNGLAIGAIYSLANPLAADGSDLAQDEDYVLAIGDYVITGIDGLDVSLTEVVPFGTGDEVETVYTFTPAEGYTFVRMNPEADNSQAGMDMLTVKEPLI